MIAILQGGSLYLMVNLWLDGQVSTGIVVLVQTYMIMLFDSLWNLGRSLMRLVKDLSNAQEMVDIFDKPIDILDIDNPEEVANKWDIVGLVAEFSKGFAEYESFKN